jgi:LPS-assembly protein
MGKYLWISLIASTLLLGDERVELFGSSADVNGTIAHATLNPVIIYQDQILSADELTYDQNSSIVEAKGSVNVFKAKQYHAISDYSRVDIAKNTRYSKPYYMFDQVSGLWVSAAEAETCNNQIDLSSGAISGCDSHDPLWKIRFSSADYDTDAMWINLYNTRLEVNNVPVFYLPYFGYPTDRTRRSGLLIPAFGFSNTEGFYYQQPIYIAPKNWWDIELRPQVRTSRGSGMYADFRFVDTPSSNGSIGMGYFKEQNAYAIENNLAHDQHYGYSVNYTHSAPLREWFDLNLDGESGLYVKGLWVNDVDYLNLQHTDETQNTTANQIISRMNAYYSGEDNYLGAYFKYYQYLNQQSNAQTIQTLPSFQYHRYLSNFLNNHLLINGDATATNYYRPEGKNAVQGDFNIPFIFQTALFDEYLDLSYTANAASRVIGFYGSQKPGEVGSQYDQGLYTQLDHTLSLSTSLVRAYESITHVITPSISYTAAGNRTYHGYYKTYHTSGECIIGSTNPACEYYALNEPSDTLSFGINNYLLEGTHQRLFDRLSQNFRYNEQRNYYGELQNELELEISSAISYYNQTAYNRDRNRVTKEQNTLRYNDGVITAGVSHYYTDELRNNVPEYASYLIADASYQYNHDYRFFANTAYDYQAQLVKRAEIGFLHTQRCLDFGLKFVRNLRPILTNGNVDNSVDDSYIFITIILKPIGGSEFKYNLTSN